MADSILTPGHQQPITDNSPTIPETQYLEKDRFLGEYSGDEQAQALVQDHLNIPSKDDVYNKQEIDIRVSEFIRDAIQSYLNQEDPHGIIPQVEEMIQGMAKSDGSTPFTAPQQGVEPLMDSHLTTRKYVLSQIKQHLSSIDPHQILPQVQEMLTKYIKKSEMYTKDQIYTKKEIDKQSQVYLKNDGSTPFIRPQVGADPTIDSHLSTKRYVDNVLRSHLVDVDPHGFITILNNRLSSYIKKKDVLDKTQTYSRTQIDNLIQGAVNQAVSASIQDYLDTVNEKFEYLRKQKYIRPDGSTPFTAPQQGEAAVNPNDLVTLEQVEQKIEDIKLQLVPEEPIWITSGPVEAGAGMIQAGDTLAQQVSFQEAMDAIFYGKRVNISTPELAPVGKVFPITVCITGSLATVEYAEVYQDGKYLTVITREQLQESSCITIDSNAITNDSEVTVKVYYTNGSIHEVSSITRVSLPVFAGLLPKWKFGNTVNYEYLLELNKGDKINNKFYNKGINFQELIHTYKFDSDELVHLFIAVPSNYSDLTEMSNSSQQYTIDAFDVIDMIPFEVPGSPEDIIYKLYIYKQTLYSLDSTIKFKFSEK